LQAEVARKIILLPECLDDYVAEHGPARAIEASMDELDLRGLGFEQWHPKQLADRPITPMNFRRVPN
jgi:hypothetical protein